MLKKIIVFIALGISFLASAQEVKKEYKRFETRPENEKFIINYSDQVSFKVYGIIKSNKIAHVNAATEKKLEYKPNESFNIGFGLGYKWLGLDLAFNFSGVNDDDDQFGETKRIDLQSNIYTRKFAADLTFQRYKGYYLANPKGYIPGFDPNGPYPIRPDVQSSVYGVSLLYVFKHDKFSYRAAFTYNERQIKSTGSFLAGPFFNYFKMDADSSLIIQEAVLDFDSLQDFRGSEYFRFGLSGGYAYNLVIGKRVFLSLTAVVGLGPEIKKTPAINGNEAFNESKFTGRMGLRAALGYNSEKFFAGLSAVGVFAGERDKGEDYLERGVSNLKIFIGRRFNTPQFLQKK